MLRVLRYINEVHREQSFSRAAQKLFISQSSLSLTIKKFEEKIGAQIFDRSTVPIQLTETGKVYLDGIQKILRIQNDLDTYLDDYNELRTGTISVGAPHMFSSYLLPPLIARFLELAPGVSLRLDEADFLTLRELVLNGDTDILIESQDFDEALFQSIPLFREQILLAVPLDDPINETLRERRLSVEDVCQNRHMDEEWPVVSLRGFRKHRFLMLEKGHDMRARATRLCRSSGFEPRIFMVLKQLTTAYSLADQRLGVSFMSDTIVKLSGKEKNLCFYKIPGQLSVRHVNLAYKRNRYVTRAMREFIDMVAAISAGGVNAVAAPQRRG